MKKVKFFRKSTYETRRVVVPDGLGVSISLKDWIAHDNLVFNRCFLCEGKEAI